MRSFRSKPVGWRYESARHSLAAKGIRTRYCADVDDTSIQSQLFEEQQEAGREAKMAGLKLRALGEIQREMPDTASKMWIEKERADTAGEIGRKEMSAEMLSRMRKLYEYKKWQDRLKGGLADGMIPQDFSVEQLKKGVKVEREHTKDDMLALEIAMDHLYEDKKYYDHLEEMEKKYQKMGMGKKRYMDEKDDYEEFLEKQEKLMKDQAGKEAELERTIERLSRIEGSGDANLEYDVNYLRNRRNKIIAELNEDASEARKEQIERQIDLIEKQKEIGE